MGQRIVIAMKKQYQDTSGEHRQRKIAQGMVEFALALPFFLFILLGIFSFATLVFNYISNISASREAARYGIASGLTPGGTPHYQDCDGIHDHAKQIGWFLNLQDSDITISYDSGPGKTPFANCPSGGTGPILITGDRISVTVSSTFQSSVPLLNLPTIPISTTSTRTVIREIYLP